MAPDKLASKNKTRQVGQVRRDFEYDVVKKKNSKKNNNIVFKD